MAQLARSSLSHRRQRRPAQRGALLFVPAFLALAAWMVTFLPSSSSATTPRGVEVTVTASPASGGTVTAGSTITYRLHVESGQPLPAGLTVVDDLGGLLGHARISTPDDRLAEDGLRLSADAKQLTWSVADGAGPDSAVADASFDATVAPDAPGGARLTTAAAPQGETCSDGDPCATSLTVQADSSASPDPSTNPTPTDTASPTPGSTPTPSDPSSPSSTPTDKPTETPSGTPSTGPASPTTTAGTPTPSPSPTAETPTSPTRPAVVPTPAGGVTVRSHMARPADAAAIPCTDPQNGPVVVGGFEIDGNLCTNNVNNSDWDTAGTQPVATDPIGNADISSFSGGVSEDNGPNWTIADSTNPGGVPAGQARNDIGNMYASTRVVGADVFTYFGFQLVGGTGTMSLHIELNQKPNADTSCPRGNRGVPSPCRTPGDLLLAFEKDGSNPITLAQAWSWNGSAWVPRPVTGVAVGRANNSAIHSLTGSTLLAGQFGEVAVNLTSLFGPGSCSGNFGTLNVRTSASTTLTSNLVDWVQPIDLRVPSTCPKVVLQKHWLNGSAGDTAGLSINGATTAPGFATSTATGSAVFTDATHQATAAVEPGSRVNLAETLGASNTGTYTSTIGCDNAILTPAQPGTSASFTMPAGANASTTVTCTVTNTRRQATLTLEKVWGSATAGDTADLTIDTPQGSTGPVRSTAPTGASVSAPVLSGDPVSVVEVLGDANLASYDATTVCTNVDGFVAGDFGGSFTVPDVPSDIVCTITNTAIPAQLVLSKDWVNGAAGDTAELTITNVDDPTDTDSAVATVPVGRGVRSTNSARLSIIPGETVTLAEVLPAPGRTNLGSYEPTSLVCNGDPVEFTGSGGAAASATATFQVTSSGPVACVYTNTRQQAEVVLQKHWTNGAAGDRADLSITGGVTDPATATSTANGQPEFTDTGHQAGTEVLTGRVVTLGEDLPAANTGSYDTALSCDQGVTPGPGGSFTLTPDLAGTTITCTLTNTRQQATVVLQKHWNNGATGDAADLTITGGLTDPAEATSTVTTASGPTFTDEDNQATTGVLTGNQVTLSETLPGTNAGSYDSSLACDHQITPGADGTFTITANLAGTTITCTVTNTRQQATVVLQKHWNRGATGDGADLRITGGVPSPAEATSTVTRATGHTFTDTTNQAATAVRTGDRISLSETLHGGNSADYASALSCDQGVTPDDGGSFTVTAELAQTTVTCTITNVRKATPPPSPSASPSTTPPSIAPTSVATASPAPSALPTTQSGPVPLTGDTGGAGPGADTGYVVPWGLGGLVFLVTAGGLLAWWRGRHA
jgi:hypothetical protein